MSPFEVTATQESEGYEVKETLAGTRIRTELKDIGASLTIVTKDFMDDLAISSLTELADFLPSTEVSNETDTDATFRANSFRIRGLFTEAIGRNNFTGLVGEHNAPPDNFNVDAVTLSAGANSMLFGSASPAGILNTSSARAQLNRDSKQVRYRTDNYGSQRLELSTNKVLIKDKLAFRINLLSDRQEYFRDPQWLNQKRSYGAIAWKPFSKTKIDANYENLDYARNVPTSSVLTDGFRGWIAAGSPTKPVNGVTNPATTVGIRNAGTANTTKVIFGSAGPMNVVQNWRNYAISAQTQVGVTATNPSLALDFMDHTQNFTSDMRIDDRQGRTGDITISQEVTPNFHMQLAGYWSHQRKDIWSTGFGGLVVDVSETLPNGSPNPNLRRYYTSSNPINLRDFLYEDTTYRWTGTYDLDLQRFNRWLGRHQIVALAEWREGIRHTDRRQLLNTTPLPGYNADILNTQNAPQVVFYVDLDGGLRNTGQPTNVREMSRYISSLDGINAELLGNLAGTYTTTVQKAYLLAAQSHWLKDRLVTTFNYRIDTQDVAEIDDSVWPKDSRGSFLGYREINLPQTPNQSSSGVAEPTYTRGAVFHAIKDWKWIDRLSLTYNYSTNFEPSPATRNFQNEPPPPSSGVTEDIGVGFSLFGNRLNGRISHYTGGQKNARAGGIANSVQSRMNAIWEVLADTVDKSYRLRIIDNETGTAETRDEDVEGIEMTMTYNPMRNWRILTTASRNDTARANQSPSARKYMAENFPMLLQSYANVVIPSQSNRTVAELIALMKESAEIESLNDGLKASELRPWKFSVVTNYSFASGRLKGFGMGGFVNWQDAALLGYGRDENNRIDRTRPFFAERLFNMGLHVSYSRRLFGDKVTWKIQANVRNLIDDRYYGTNAVEDVTNPGKFVITNYRMLEPRSVVLTNTFSF